MKTKTSIALACIVSNLSACAPSSDKIQAQYVSPMQYHGYSCSQIRQEMMAVTRKVNQVSGEQDSHASNDAVAMGVGLVLFWPSLFFLANKDQRAEVARLKGEFDALESAAIQKNCSVAKELEAARKMEESRQEKKKAENTKEPPNH